MNSPARTPPREHPLLLICGCALLIGFVIFDKPPARIPPAKKRPTRLASSIQTAPVQTTTAISNVEPDNESPVDPDAENDIKVLQQKLDSTEDELQRISWEVAAARRAAELAGAQIDCLESELSRFDVDMAVAGKRLADLIQQKSELANHTQERLARSAEIVKNFEASQKQHLVQQFQQIEKDRKSREQMRARLNQPPEVQNESIRERQRKRAVSRQADAELAAFREQESNRLNAEELAIQTQVSQAERLQREVAAQRQETLVRLDGVRQTLLACQSMIDRNQPRLSQLEGQRASLIASTRVANHH